ncbi:MAG: sigma-70 family RNA polymerase sigma factor, partial [Eubacteriales bacterium]|nr:sigma-70 family RNA polymerase sigma factor [Eubacteriales bacterium]
MSSQLKKMTEQELFSRYEKHKDDALREYLLKKYLYIAEIVAKKFVGRGVEYDDLFQVASLSLIKAVDRYETDRGVKFASFATPTLVGEIKNYFRDKTRTIRISRRDSEMIRKLDDTKEYLSSQHGRSVTPEEIADYLDISIERVLELMETQSAAYATSLDNYIAINEDIKLIKLLGNTDDEYEKIENRDFLQYCIAHLNDIEKQLIEERYTNGKSQ